MSCGEIPQECPIEFAIKNKVIQSRVVEYYELKYDVGQAKAIRIEAESLLYTTKLLRRDYYGNP